MRFTHPTTGKSWTEYVDWKGVIAEAHVAEKAAAEIVSLPMFPQLTSDQQRRVVSCIREFQATKAPRAVKYAVASY